MHLVCIGVFKQMIRSWSRGKLFYRLMTYQISCISRILTSLRPFISRLDFARRPRPLDCIDQYKATELRLILLYIGPCTNKLKHLIDFAETLLKNFVETYEIIYQRHCVTFNIHGLLHLVEDVRHFGPVDSFSAFCFESHLKVLKNLIRKSDRLLEQLYNRYIERRNFCNVSVKSSKFVFQEKKEHTKGPDTFVQKSSVSGR